MRSRVGSFVACHIAALVLASCADAWLMSVPAPPGSSGDTANAIAIDDNGDTLVVGHTTEALTASKIDADSGREMWRSQLGALSAGLCGALAPNGDVIAAGGTGLSVEFVVARVAGETGAPLWETFVTDPIQETGGSRRGFALAVTSDAAGDVYATGALDGGVGWGDPSALAVVKLSGNTGVEKWRYVLSGTAGRGMGRAILVDDAGDVLVAGGANNQLEVIKLSAIDGTEIWRRSSPSGLPDGIADVVASLVLGPSEDVFVAVAAHDGNNETPTTIERLDGNDGSLEWLYAVVGPFFVDTAKLAMAPDGDLVAMFDNWVGKVRAADGAELWTTTASPSVPSFFRPRFTLDEDGDLLIVTLENAPGDDFQLNVIERAGATGDLLAIEAVTPSVALIPSDIATHPRGMIVAGAAPAGDFRTLFSVFGLGDGATGRKLLLKDSGDPAVRRLRLVAKEPWLALPAAGAAGAPTVVGATLELSNPSTAETITIALPASNWTGTLSPLPGASTFKYVDKSLAAGPCKVVVLKGNRVFKAKCDGPGASFSLDEASQGAVDVRLSFPGGGGFSRCLSFGGTTLVDEPGQFIAKDAPAPSTCSGGL